jgi:hypothetical protein
MIMAQLSPTPMLSSAVQDLGLGNNTMQKTATELAEAKRRKRLFGDTSNASAPLGSAAVMSLTGNQY